MAAKPTTPRPAPPDGAATAGQPASREPYWPASLSVLAAVVLYLTLPERLTLGPAWLMPSLDGALLVPLATHHRHSREARWVRPAAVSLAGLVSLANLLALQQLVVLLLHPGQGGGLLRGGRALDGRQLIVSAIAIWLTNVIVFGLWYWELDRGGPAARSAGRRRHPDFLFPQMASPWVARPHWSPRFLDYLYVSFTNSTALSPADTAPLTRWAKLLMLAQALASLLTVALVAARAVNILG
jgi:uncharacterized membrane protein